MMRSRMDKYQTSTQKKYERIKKNTKLYEEVYDDIYRDTTYQNMQVLDSAKEINLNKLRDIIDNNYDTRQYRTLRNYDKNDILEEDIITDKKREKVYDINEIINQAKNKRAFIEEAKEKKKYIDFSLEKQEKNQEFRKLEDEEQELEELINTMVISNKDNDSNEELDLFSDLKGSENTIVTNPIKTSFDEEDDLDTKQNDAVNESMKADKTFYTDSNIFTKNDFEDFSTLTRELSKSSNLKKVIIVILVLLILGVLLYFLITNFIIK